MNLIVGQSSGDLALPLRHHQNIFICRSGQFLSFLEESFNPFPGIGVWLLVFSSEVIKGGYRGLFIINEEFLVVPVSHPESNHCPLLCLVSAIPKTISEISPRHGSLNSYWDTGSIVT